MNLVASDIQQEVGMDRKRKPYGFELILDLHGCDTSKFNRDCIKEYMIAICEAIKMDREDLYFWDYDGIPEAERPSEAHLLGTSAVQFISTSNIVIHTLDLLKSVYVNIFSCKPFDRNIAENVTKKWFNADDCRTHFIERI